jgi:hypothetical protein
MEVTRRDSAGAGVFSGISCFRFCCLCVLRLLWAQGVQMRDFCSVIEAPAGLFAFIDRIQQGNRVLTDGLNSGRQVSHDRSMPKDSVSVVGLGWKIDRQTIYTAYIPMEYRT